ncbi:putative selenate ABC transporter substrate-binding protein [Synechococcus sp. PCC 7336]|uniref:putative selenate ABC transporter substrate-binding protein n=1 Tax=Synechococcus sp. PCC 7336 TaxID=195250 RepID=UPI00034A0AF7|nr:putative selenate ABC transporter substrate-binding protein [Synechococcus sp. PCC 7336]
MKSPVWTVLLLIVLPLAACAPSSTSTTEVEPFVTGAIPDRDPEKLQRRYGLLSDYLEAELGVPVDYRPVTDYTAAVTAFRVGDLDMVWFGGLTGVQARLQVPGAEAIAQRDIDEQFHSVFIANVDSGIEPFDSLAGLTVFEDSRFTFGSESSTSGRLMPQFFLQQAGVELNEFRGEVGFSGSHDATIQLVEAGTYEAGAVNEQVWRSRLEAGEVDRDRVREVWRSPAYFDYHWVIRPEVEDRYGEGFSDRVREALLQLDPEVPEQREILDLFGAGRFIPTHESNYAQIEAVGRQIGKIQ